jgi:hypothetical protein
LRRHLDAEQRRYEILGIVTGAPRLDDDHHVLPLEELERGVGDEREICVGVVEGGSQLRVPLAALQPRLGHLTQLLDRGAGLRGELTKGRRRRRVVLLEAIRRLADLCRLLCQQLRLLVVFRRGPRARKTEGDRHQPVALTREIERRDAGRQIAGRDLGELLLNAGECEPADVTDAHRGHPDGGEGGEQLRPQAFRDARLLCQLRCHANTRRPRIGAPIGASRAAASRTTSRGRTRRSLAQNL